MSALGRQSTGTSDLKTSLGYRENPVLKEKTTYYLLTTKQNKTKNTPKQTNKKKNGKERHSSVVELAYLKS